MKIGINLASVAGLDPGNGLRAYLDLAEHAEQIGFDSVWAPDQPGMPEPLTLLAALAQVTRRVEIGTLDLAIALRHPLMTAKMLSTADRLSGGRVILSAGTGTIEGDFGAVGVPQLFAEREAVTDDYLRAIKESWLNTGPSRYTGEYVRFAEIGTFPHPVRQPHTPIWIAASGADWVRRAVRIGSGFISHARDVESFARERAEARRLAEQDRRDPDEIVGVLAAGVSAGATATTSERAFLSGSRAQLREQFQRLEEAGVDHLIATVSTGEAASLTATMEAVQALAEILPAKQSTAAGGGA